MGKTWKISKKTSFKIACRTREGEKTEDRTGYIVTVAGMKGVKLMVHRDKDRWTLSEYRTGLMAVNNGKTREGIINRGLSAMDIRGITADKIKTECWPIYPVVNE